MGIGRDDIDNRHLCFGRQIIAHLVDLGVNLGQGLGGVVIKLEPDRNRGEAQLAGGLDVIDAISGSDRAFQRSGDKATNQVSAGADINGRDRHRRIITARVLPDGDGSDGLNSGDQDHQVDHEGQYRSADE